MLLSGVVVFFVFFCCWIINLLLLLYWSVRWKIKIRKWVRYGSLWMEDFHRSCLWQMMTHPEGVSHYVRSRSHPSSLTRSWLKEVRAKLDFGLFFLHPWQEVPVTAFALGVFSRLSLSILGSFFSLSQIKESLTERAEKVPAIPCGHGFGCVQITGRWHYSLQLGAEAREGAAGTSS